MGLLLPFLFFRFSLERICGAMAYAKTLTVLAGLTTFAALVNAGTCVPEEQSVAPADSALMQLGAVYQANATGWNVGGHTRAGKRNLAVGGFGTCAVGADGLARCWGKNRYGEDTVPASLSGAGIVAFMDKGEEASCAVRTDNGLGECFGTHFHGSRLPSPAALEALGELTAIAVGAYGSCFANTAGEVTCFGLYTTWTSVPAGLTGVHTLTAGHGGPVCAVSGTLGEAGDLTCWVMNGFSVPNYGKVKTVDAGSGTACVIKEDDTVGCFKGFNYGGNGITSVPGDLGPVLGVSVGMNAACAIQASDSNVRCWGSGSATNRPADLGAVEFLRMGYHFACAVKSSDATLVCWGDSTTQTSVPSGLGAVAMDGSPGSLAASPSVAGNAAQAVGDPHLRNINGERFDLMQPGRHTLLHIPKGADALDTLLQVEAEARVSGSQCADMYFQELNFTGVWVEARHEGAFQFRAGEDGDKRESMWMSFGEVDLKVAHGHTQQGIRYLNFYVRHLGRTGLVVGGLLGVDDHTAAATPSQNCARTWSLKAASGSDLAYDLTASSSSFAEASLA